MTSPRTPRGEAREVRACARRPFHRGGLGARVLWSAFLLSTLSACGSDASPTPVVDGPLPPPIQNAVFLEPGILTRFDPTTYEGLVDAGRDTPATLRKGVRTLVIHRGDESFGGSPGTVLVHTFRGETRFTQGVLEETLVHEATHAALDSLYRNSEGWLAAQAADNRFLTPHALENPTTEDIAASFLPYLALRYRRDRLSDAAADTIATAIPHRIAFFDSLPFERYPWD